MSTEKNGRRPKALVIGAGIGGLTAAIALREAGLDVEIHERAGVLRAAGSGLSVMSNAVGALESLGVGIDLESRGTALESYHVRTARGRLIREFPFPEIIGRLGVPSVLITRSDLQQALLEAAEGIPLTLGSAASGFETEPTGGVRVTFEDGRVERGDLLIGADGFHSVVRRQLAGPEPSQDSGYVCWLAVVPYSHPRFAPGSVIHYWGSGRRFGLVDMGGGRLYWWGTKNMPAERSHDWKGTKEEILRTYAGWADEVVHAIEVTPEESVIAVPSRDRPFLERWGSGPVTLLGDAAHPMLTSLGQGSGMAIEDAVVLGRALRGAEDLPRALRRYEDERRERTRALVAASRGISDFEQSEGLRRPIRDAYFRFMPRARLVRTLEDSLTFTPPSFRTAPATGVAA
ncbi:FAD-dependent monooxygenase [Streptomyces caelestis]|jgi:2-polyprenyl-6-methoxyphenol hydroxylase-like FAD-dependent oxidoreductase|uniref:2-polyprenyl-6-methoxyphenol hydroxylase-like FAD-dependent oxidoreductase n=1 Tax=Streptomyces caelestis TaxID=36816 RepID=A0A7W9GZG3_9ACTN|nr:NAD(P)/FAD-dependent oxidoreductase [Streptomyces caelestis]MBB5792501.1 2-polyprenyl-6-methoxyphenol hydroxylase-like FAD-dependent oxidoreductase [Streptomyces caelestis]GGW70842.1 FAD-dependent monooxygenase [Streptomyces caelestis]